MPISQAVKMITLSDINFYTTKEAAIKIGRSRDTILRWIREGKIRDVSRDYKNHRVWTEKDIRKFQEFARNVFQRGNL